MAPTSNEDGTGTWMVGMREKPSRTMGGTGSFIKVQTGQAERCLSGKPPRSLPPLPPWSCVNLLHLPSRVKYSKLSTVLRTWLGCVLPASIKDRQSVSHSTIQSILTCISDNNQSLTPIRLFMYPRGLSKLGNSPASGNPNNCKARGKDSLTILIDGLRKEWNNQAGNSESSVQEGFIILKGSQVHV